MKNSPTTTMNEDMILEILSHCPATEIARFRLLNKECNKRSYGFGFLNSHLQRTNSVFGYIIEYTNYYKYLSRFVSGVQEEEALGISLNFLPSISVKIQACDTNHGILLCVDDNKYKGGYNVPDYIVCKPATKQYELISNPKTRYFTVATGLMVIQSNPFRYKIVRVSQPLVRDRRNMREGFYNQNCEVFDSDSSKWRRLNDLELPHNELIRSSVSDKPVSAYGCLHWLTSNNVIQFCMRTETWSTFPVPDNLKHSELVSYEGKLGVIGSRSREEDDLWVLENSLGNSWTTVKKYVKTEGDELLWFPSSDVVSTAGNYRLGLYNMNSNKVRHIHKKISSFSGYNGPVRSNCFPFYSNYDRVALNEDHVRRSNGKIKDSKEKMERMKISC